MTHLVQDEKWPTAKAMIDHCVKILTAPKLTEKSRKTAILMLQGVAEIIGAETSKE
jgi:hypothetical protein